MLKTNVNQSDINNLTIAELRNNSPFANTALPTETEAQAAFSLLSNLLREASFIAIPGGMISNIDAFNSSSVWSDDDSFATFAQKQKVKEFVTGATKIEGTTPSEQDVLFFCFKLIRPIVNLLSTQILSQTAAQSAPTEAAIEIQLHEQVARLSDPQMKKNLTVDPGYFSFIAEVQACYYQELTKVASEQITAMTGETIVAAWWRYHNANQTLPTAHQTLLPNLNEVLGFIQSGIFDKDSDYRRHEFVLLMLQLHGDKIRRFSRHLASSQLFEPYLGKISDKDAWQLLKKIATQFLAQNSVSWSLPENSRQQKALVLAETLLDSSLFDRSNDDDSNMAYQVATLLTREAEGEVFASPAIISAEEQETARAQVRNDSTTPPALKSEVSTALTTLSGAATKSALIRYLGSVLLKNKLFKAGQLSLNKIFTIVTDLPAFYQLANDCADQTNPDDSEETLPANDIGRLEQALNPVNTERPLPANDIGRLDQALQPVNPERSAGEIKAIGLAVITDYLYPPNEYKAGYIANFNLYTGALGNDTFTQVTANLAIRLSIYLKIPLSNTTRAESRLALALLASRYAPELLVRDIRPQQTYGFEMTSVDFRHGVTMAERVQPGSSTAYSFNAICNLATNDDMEWAMDEQKIAVTSARLAPLLQHAMSRRLIPASDLDKVTAANQKVAVDYEINRKTQEAKDLEALMASAPDRKVTASAQLKQYHPHISIDEKISVPKLLNAGSLEMTRIEQYMTYSGKFYYNDQDLGFQRGQAMSAEILDHDFNEDYASFEIKYKAALISRLSWAIKDLFRVDRHRLLGITAKNLKLVQVAFSNDKDEKEKGYRGQSSKVKITVSDLPIKYCHWQGELNH
ncbi:hypothetical protein CCS41_04270 [Candidatus Fukatsuia symbiotica]|uniref:Uncharacterized protein n=1 Tax=Candidatus Fukatsuia symbiotica TaxID=1878942 RepID=A0A2U8I6R6_9GAMM|nr:hypothetical protein [Candidatus Fukatsuia symbiotica]AWK13865.1 hypothetical protein CCS41_04270 [Candidatus Fukatsuia symbiotica]